jgi:NAD-reducing hydrogenase small subunit
MGKSGEGKDHKAADGDHGPSGGLRLNGNVSALRNPGDRETVLETSYGDAVRNPGLPLLEPNVLQLRQVIRVDAFIPGCPPDPALIRQVIVQRPQRR